ncbi:TetR/AcrR family transcriptional regulator [bacterium]|nr:TetR/AcrR family transcriptional regulator [bacterium]
MPRGDKRKAIMETAEKLFTSRRFHEITLDDIVEAAHIGKGTIYTYFKDKDDLFFQVALSGFDEMCDLLRRRVTEEAPFREQLLQACAAIHSFFSRRRQLSRMIQSEEARMPFSKGPLRDRWLEKRAQMVDALGQIMRKGQSEGAVRPDLPPEVLSAFMLALLRARARELGEGVDPVSDPTLVDFFLQGARDCKPSGIPN